MNPKTLTTEDLRQFIGTEHWYRHGMVKEILFTDGVKYVADQAGAYCLVDEIALAQRFETRVSRETFQLWKLVVKPDHTAVLFCEDGNGNPVYSKSIEFTDFPLPEISLYLTDRTILLPSEC